MALRYFYEQVPDLHVIGAGSLLEFALEAERLRIPVGRIQPLFMHPLVVRRVLVGGRRGARVAGFKDTCRHPDHRRP